MDIIETKKPFNKRAFTALVLFLSGVTLPVSGMMNHELQYSLLTPEKHFWMSFHNIAAFIFCVSAIAHISLNRHSLLHYTKKMKGSILTKEAIAAFILVAGIVFLFSLHAFHVK